MKNTETKTQNKAQQVIIFGDAFENKKLGLKEFVTILRNKYNSDELEVGKLAYYALAMRQEKLIDVSYIELVAIIKKIFELNNLTTNTTVKCMAYYNRKLKDLDITKPYTTNSNRTNRVIDINSLFE